MDERIRLIAEEATRKYDRLGNEIPYAHPDLELFARLIVQECAMFVVLELEGKVGSAIADATANRLEEHFGVEG